MSTRSLIGYVDKDTDIVHLTYCHCDGYLAVVGKTLFEHYNSYEKAKELVDTFPQGFSSLGDTIEETALEAYIDEPMDIEIDYTDFRHNNYCLPDGNYCAEYIYIYHPMFDIGWEVNPLYPINLDRINDCGAWDYL